MDIVYILTNPALTGYVKIGITTNLTERLKQLDNTSIPLPFECYYAVEVPNGQEVEKLLHEAFDSMRIRKNREFFEILPESAKSALKIANGKDVTPGEDIVETADDKRALDKAKALRERFKFSLLNIEPGTILTFAKDPNITCEVVDDRLVNFRGEDMSLTASALIIIKELGYNWTQISGPSFWQYKGKGLYDLRLESDV